MSHTTVEKACPHVAITRLARKAMVELSINTEAKEKIRDYFNDTVSDMVKKAIQCAHQCSRKTVSAKDLLDHLKVDSVVRAHLVEGVRVPTCPKKSFRLATCNDKQNKKFEHDVGEGLLKRPDGADRKKCTVPGAHLEKVKAEVKYYSAQGNCVLLPKQAFANLVKNALKDQNVEKKISGDALDLLQVQTEVNLLKLINGAAQIAHSNKRTTVNGANVEAARKVMKIAH